MKGFFKSKKRKVQVRLGNPVKTKISLVALVIIIVASLMLFLYLARPRIYQSKVPSEQIIAPVPAALIKTTDGLTCSGLLVGKKSVLTAAHCTPKITGRSAATYTVQIGQENFSISNFAAHPNYRFQLHVTPENSRYDVAVLELTQIVNSYRPVPVLLAEPLESSDTFDLYAFGRSNSNLEPIIQNTQFATFFVEETLPGLVLTKYQSSKAALCSGDSGGVGIVSSKFSTVAVSVASASVNPSKNDLGCDLGPEGKSMFVNLGDAEIQTFLLNQPDINFISSQKIILEEELLRAYEMLNEIFNSKITAKARAVLKQTQQQLAYIQNQNLGVDSGKIKAIMRQLKTSKKGAKINTLKKQATRAQTAIRKVLEDSRSNPN